MKNITLAEAMKEFEINLKMKGKSENTITKYIPSVKELMEEYYKKNIDEIMLDEVHITSKEFNKFYTVLSYNNNWKETTFNVKLSAIKEFSLFLENEYDIYISCKGVKSKKVKKKKIVYMNVEETKEFWNVVKNKSFYVRDEDFNNKKLKAIVSLMLFGGLRSKEVKLLKIDDIVIKNGKCSVNVRNEISKTGSYRRTPIINKEGGEAIIEYIKARKERLEKLGVESDIFIFGKTLNEPISISGIKDIINNKILGDKAIKEQDLKGLSPHKFRHTFACLVYEESKNINLTMEVMGHTDVRTTQIYAKNMDLDNKIDSLEINF